MAQNEVIQQFNHILLNFFLCIRKILLFTLTKGEYAVGTYVVE